jgi:hypothetical protein
MRMYCCVSVDGADEVVGVFRERVQARQWGQGRRVVELDNVFLLLDVPIEGLRLYRGHAWYDRVRPAL